jgi:hypothetical protein
MRLAFSPESDLWVVQGKYAGGWQMWAVFANREKAESCAEEECHQRPRAEFRVVRYANVGPTSTYRHKPPSPRELRRRATYEAIARRKEAP